MNKKLTGIALAAIFLASTTAFAATATTSASKGVDYAVRCKSLAEQWKTAESGHGTNANLGKAKGDAEKAEKLCGSKKSSDHRKGAMDYEAAIKLLGVTPT